MLGAVVWRGAVRTDNGHRHVSRGDRHVAIGDVEDDAGEVGVGVHKLVGSQTHVGRSGISSRCRGRPADCEIVLRIEVGLLTANQDAGHFITAHAVLLTVIANRGMVSCDGDGHSRRADGDVAICDIEGHVEVRVGIRELVCGHTHVGGARSASRSRGITAEGEIMVHIVQVDVRRCGVAAHAVFLTIIVGGVMCTDNGHGHLNRVDGLVAIGHVEGDGAEVRVGVRELTCHHTHVGRTDIGSGCRGITAEGEVVGRV